MKLPIDATPRAVALLARIFNPRNTTADGVHVPSTIPASDIQWLIDHGLDPHQRIPLDHDAAIATIKSATLSVGDGAKAFMASLAGDLPRGCYLEAALLAASMPEHSATDPTWCRVCGVSAGATITPAEQFLHWSTWGSGIPGDIVWALEALQRLAEAPSEPSPVLAHVLHVLDNLPPKARAGSAFDAVAALGFTRQAAQSIVGTLAFAGILEAPPHVGLATRFVSFAERDQRPSVRNENDAPLGFWSGAYGVNWVNAERLFGLTKSSELPAIERKAPVKARRASASTVRPKTLPRRPPEPGDLWAVRMREDAWAFIYVWKIEERAGRPYALTEVVGDASPMCPIQPPSQTLVTRPRYDGRWQMWTSTLEKTTGSALIATNLATPSTNAPEPDRVPIGSGKDLGWLAKDCFRGME